MCQCPISNSQPTAPERNCLRAESPNEPILPFNSKKPQLFAPPNGEPMANPRLPGHPPLGNHVEGDSCPGWSPTFRDVDPGGAQSRYVLNWKIASHAYVKYPVGSWL